MEKVDAAWRRWNDGLDYDERTVAAEGRDTLVISLDPAGFSIYWQERRYWLTSVELLEAVP